MHKVALHFTLVCARVSTVHSLMYGNLLPSGLETVALNIVHSVIVVCPGLWGPGCVTKRYNLHMNKRTGVC